MGSAVLGPFYRSYAFIKPVPYTYNLEVFFILLNVKLFGLKFTCPYEYFVYSYVWPLIGYLLQFYC